MGLQTQGCKCEHWAPGVNVAWAYMCGSFHRRRHDADSTGPRACRTWLRSHTECMRPHTPPASHSKFKASGKGHRPAGSSTHRMMESRIPKARTGAGRTWLALLPCRARDAVTAGLTLLASGAYEARCPRETSERKPQSHTEQPALRV